MKYKSTYLSLSLACLLGSFSQQAYSIVTLDFAGVGTAIAGTADASDLAVGDSVLFTGLGDASMGATFDAILTLDALSANPTNSTTASFDTSTAGTFVTVSSGSVADSFGVFTLSFIESGTSSAANPFGDAAALIGVTSFLAQDIDSAGGNFSDVFGFALTGQETMIVRGSALVNAGFINNNDPVLADFDLSRVNENSGGTGMGADLTFIGEGNELRSSVPNQTDFQFDNATISSLQFVFGTTSTNENQTVGNRGLLAELDFTGVTAIPEPSASLLSLIAIVSSICRRKRR